MSQQEKIYTVTQITREIKRVIHEGFGALWVEGEISGYKRHTSGHHYFTLKDGASQMSCAMWKMSAGWLTFQPQDGMKVQVWGNLEVYEPAGRYQLIALQMRPSGVGELQRAFEVLVQKLRAEGLFELERKRPLPPYPETIGLITSADGAALHDMRTVAARRWPGVQLVLAPVKVQGTGAAQEIASAIRAFNREGLADVLVVGRGGGSLEDLWAFNEEIVARAIFESRIPVVSAVGHEVDFTVADLVADVRAPTPSAAMELVLPDCQDVADYVAELKRRLASRRVEQLRSLRQRLDALSRHWALRQPVNLVHANTQRLDDLHSRLEAASSRLLKDKQHSLERVRELLTLFHPQAILERGYAVVRDGDGQYVRDVRALTPGAGVSIFFARGRADAQIQHIHDNGNLDEPH
ncbi:MAG TPA: exodeoxyribonuclease VII large subunit [bacterium]|jgi:exodeoxyribonuclease VII large subunit